MFLLSQSYWLWINKPSKVFRYFFPWYFLQFVWVKFNQWNLMPFCKKIVRILDYLKKKKQFNIPQTISSKWDGQELCVNHNNVIEVFTTFLVVLVFHDIFKLILKTLWLFIFKLYLQRHSLRLWTKAFLTLRISAARMF